MSTSTPVPYPWSQWRLNPPTVIPTSSPILSHQSSLPPLPVPALASTLAKLRTSAEALRSTVTATEWTEFERRLKEFGEGRVGEELQRRLEEKARKDETGNWIAEWWDTAAYMAYRDSVVVNVSYYFGFPRLPQSSSSGDSNQTDPSYVSATLLLSALAFRDLLTSGTLPPDAIGGSPLCMESYKWMFNSCRIPQKPADYAVKVREDEEGDAQCAVVLRRGWIWKVQLADGEGRSLKLEELQRSIQHIYNNTPKDRAPQVGILTAANRDHWTDARAELVTSQSNASILKLIESSAFLLCLDDEHPTSTPSGIIDFSRRLWHGTRQNAGNRWWDKPLQWVVYDSGEAGFVGEHSCMDGTPTLRLNDWIAGRLLKGQLPPPAATLNPSVTTTIAEPVRVDFEVSDATRRAIDEATRAHEKVIDDQKLVYLMYEKYGKEGIKAQKCSPDGFTQMVIQLAWHLTFNHPCGTYESAQVRRFRLGRTETVRTCTPASVAFTSAMTDSSVSNARKKELFAEALKGHTRDMKDASAAMGVDRHLFGLRRCVRTEEGEQTPGLLEDAVVAKSGTWRMSTSQLVTPYFPAYGWGYVVPDGFGIPYMIHPNSLQFTVTSRKDMPAEEFVANLEKAADMVMDLMKGPPSPAKL